jgi:RNA polymerase sigma factor (sigma-70 family)
MTGWPGGPKGPPGHIIMLVELDRRDRRTGATVSIARSPSELATGRTNDDAVIERSWNEPEAFAILFDRYADDIHRYVARRLGPGPAEDALAETFVIAFQHRRRYDLSRPHARPWLYGIATNVVGRHRRTEARRLRALSRAQPPVDAEPLADRVAARITAQAARRDLAAALERMPARQRHVVLLYAWAELDYEEIAEALGIPLGTVRSRLHRARSGLRVALGGETWTS